MYIIPAIDIKNSKCVRLYQGDYNRETVYSDSPAEMARKWITEGAKWLHLVDLDGAKSGNPDNIQIIEKIAKETDVPIQLGGGIRNVKSAQEVFRIGIKRIILGTSAVDNPLLVKKLCDKFGSDSVIVSLDAKNGLIAKNGWTEKSNISAIDLAETLVNLGVRRFMYTDIERDGTLTSPNFGEIRKMVNSTNVPVLAAGGVSQMTHLAELKRIGTESVIIGTAIYEDRLNLHDAISRFQKNIFQRGIHANKKISE